MTHAVHIIELTPEKGKKKKMREQEARGSDTHTASFCRSNACADVFNLDCAIDSQAYDFEQFEQVLEAVCAHKVCVCFGFS